MNRKIHLNNVASYDAIVQHAMPFEAKRVALCVRCGDHHAIDAYDLCEKCNRKVAEEYALLYTESVMEH